MEFTITRDIISAFFHGGSRLPVLVILTKIRKYFIKKIPGNLFLNILVIYKGLNSIHTYINSFLCMQTFKITTLETVLVSYLNIFDIDVCAT